jgi:Holliday junction resolvase
MTEATLQRAIQKAIRNRGGKVIKIHGNAYAQAGTPDLIGVLDGVSFAIEVKRPGETATKLQAHELEQWGLQGWAVGVATSVDEALRIVAQEVR